MGQGRPLGPDLHRNGQGTIQALATSDREVGGVAVQVERQNSACEGMQLGGRREREEVGRDIDRPGVVCGSGRFPL